MIGHFLKLDSRNFRILIDGEVGIFLNFIGLIKWTHIHSKLRVGVLFFRYIYKGMHIYEIFNN